MQSLLLGEGDGRRGGAVGDRHGPIDASGFRPDEERPNQMAGGGAGGEPFVDVELSACRGSSVVRIVEPGQESDGFGDVLFGRVDQSPGGLTFCGDGANPFDVVRLPPRHPPVCLVQRTNDS